MKIRFYLLGLMVLFGVIISCSSHEDFDYTDDFENSQKAWLEFKKSTNNSYKYTVGFNSYTGLSKETTITVVKGIVVKRYFKSTIKGLKDNLLKEQVEWTENKSQIGVYQNGAEPITLDDVYEKSKRQWLVKRKNAKVFFEAKNNGMISSCGYVNNNCMDDCFIGITIKSITSNHLNDSNYSD